jgi:drug/metabolite transporter (DMT)-like permease
MLHERPTPALGAAILLATAGVVLVLGNGTLDLGLGWGEASALGAAFFAAVSANVIRAMRGTDNAPTIFFFFCLAGLPVVLPFALDPWPGGAVPWALAVAMALSAFAAQVLMTEAYGALSVAEAAAWLQLTTIAQYLLAALLLGERVTAVGLLGILVSVAGVAWTTMLLPRRAAVPPP